jgi:hypothetical protein
MNWWKCISALILAFASFAAYSEVVSFEIYALATEGGPRLLAKGTKTYTAGDVESQEHRLFGPQHWTKELKLTEEFYIGGSVYREQKLGGFGLWVKRHTEWFEIWKTGGFSWEWFDYRNSDDVYRKLQGTGQVKVTMSRGTGYEEIAAIEFLDDVTMRLNDHPWFTFDLNVTHHVVVRKGSILRFAP